MKKNFLYLSRYFCGILLFVAGAFSVSVPALSFFLFLLLCLFETVLVFLETRRFSDLRFWFSLSWLFGIALSRLQLSGLQSDFGIRMWITCGGFYFLLMGAFDLTRFLRERRENGGKEKESGAGNTAPVLDYGYRIFRSALLLSLTSFAGLLLESVVFRFQYPVFTVGVPHQYTAFHISGVHYFVVSSVFVPAMSVLAFLRYHLSAREKRIFILMDVYSILVQILLLSKLQILLSVGFPILLFYFLQTKYSKKRVALFSLIAGAGLIICFILFIAMRHYPEGYLSELFRFKDEEISLGIQYPYIYIVNNYENLNLLSGAGFELTYGVRCLQPFFSLTGLKFLPAIQEIMGVPVIYTAEELTTVTLLYDVLGDFGIAGVMVFSVLLGFVSEKVTTLFQRSKKLLPVLFYLQFFLYFSLSFFTTWFSNPTSWFWFFLTVLLSYLAEIPKGGKLFQKEAWLRLWR